MDEIPRYSSAWSTREGMTDVLPTITMIVINRE